MRSRATAATLCLLLTCATRAFGQAPDTVFLEELTWTEVRDLVRAGKTVVIVPTGGTEQNGPHMALGKHNVRVKALSEKIALSLGNALVAPVMAYVPEGGVNPPTAHMRFTGTISVPDDVFEKTLEYAARSFKLHGFRDIVFLGDHGGYQADEAVVVDRLNREWAKTAVRVRALAEYYRVTQLEYVQALKDKGYSTAEIGTHAGLADTSLMLAVDARMVRLDRLATETGLGPADGVYGDPRRATAALGQIGVVSVGPALGGTLTAPVGVGSEVGRGVLKGATVGGLSGAGVGAVAGFATGPLAPLAVPVFATLGALGGLVIGTGTGAVVNGINAIPTDTATEIRGVLAGAIAQRDLQSDLRQRFMARIPGANVKAAADLGMGRAGEPLPMSNYAAFAMQGVNTVLEIGVKKIALAGEGGSDPSLVLAIKARARLIRVPGNQVLWSDETLAFNSQARDFSKWTADSGLLGSEIDNGLDMIARQIDDKVL